MKRTAALIPVVVAVAAVQTAATARAQELTYNGSFQLSSGTYIFTEPTRTFSMYNGLAIAAGRLRAGASLPVILQNSGAVNLVGGGYLPTGGTENGAVGGRQQGQSVPMGPGGPHHSLIPLESVEPALQLSDSVVQEPGAYQLSLGDPLLSGAVEVYAGSGPLRSVELTGSAKAPLNDLDSGVGTGEWDFAVGGATAFALGPVLAFLDVAYWWYGDLPELTLRDGMSWGGGLGLPVTRSVWVSAMTTGTNRIIESAEAVRAATVGLSHTAAGVGTLSLTVGAGLTETSPDYTISLGWRRSLLPGR